MSGKTIKPAGFARVKNKTSVHVETGGGLRMCRGSQPLRDYRPPNALSNMSHIPPVD